MEKMRSDKWLRLGGKYWDHGCTWNFTSRYLLILVYLLLKLEQYGQGTSFSKLMELLSIVSSIYQLLLTV